MLRTKQKIALAAIVFIVFGALMQAAWSMTQSSIPTKFGIPWGNSAGASYIRTIPQASQIPFQNCAASLTDGFPPLTFTSAGAGGCAPFGQDFNGILNQITKWNQWQSAGGPVFWDSTFATNIGGYPKGAILQSSILQGRQWFNTADNNSTNPDDQTGAAANWIPLPGTKLPGEPFPQLTTTIAPMSVSANGTTVGNASSNASGRANADTFWLFSFLWTNCSTCNLFNSSGGSISRGSSAVADWAANDAITTNNMNGAGIIGADSQSGSTSTNLTGVPVISGSSTVPSSILGENLTPLTASLIPTITSSVSATSTSQFAPSNSNFSVSSGTAQSTLVFPSGGGATVSSTGTGTSNNTGGTNPSHNTVERSVIVYWDLSL